MGGWCLLDGAPTRTMFCIVILFLRLNTRQSKSRPGIGALDQKVHPAITFHVTICAKDVPRVRRVRLSLLRLDDQERVPIFVIPVKGPGGLLLPNLCSRYRNRTQMGTTLLDEQLITRQLSTERVIPIRNTPVQNPEGHNTSASSRQSVCPAWSSNPRI